MSPVGQPEQAIFHGASAVLGYFGHLKLSVDDCVAEALLHVLGGHQVEPKLLQSRFSEPIFLPLPIALISPSSL